ncbi:MAG: SPOR domain-containing protein [Marinicaulis sp.]|nr:SPOR domain-containing protein [Marinicaulis sp.]NNE42105.1 SPOR domain-containing protein [Marinicaulis sp.]NNL89192.1 SPOR domain-containing protein [Marinicaulis sp.]
MTDDKENYEEEYNEYDEFEDDDDEGGLSGLAVLAIGVLMFGAFLAVTYVAYDKGKKNGSETPYVAADPDPIKIETAEVDDEIEDREVYDVFDGDDEDPVTVLAEGPEEPVIRTPGDNVSTQGTIDDIITAEAADAADAMTDEVEESLAQLEAQDAEVLGEEADEPKATPATTPTPASATPPRATVRSGDVALSGSHVVQVGAFGSDAEARSQWARLQSDVGELLDDKSFHIEVADKGAAGVYHRLRVGPFASSDAAKSWCGEFKARGKDCLAKSL